MKRYVSQCVGLAGCCCMALLLAWGSAVAVEPKVVVRGGAEAPTKAYVWGAATHNLSGDQNDQSREAHVKDMPAAEIYKKLMAGQINVASVLLGPQEAGVKEFAAWREKNKPTMKTLGYAGVYVIAPGNREIKQLSLLQVRDLLVGKITTWKQLGGLGEGKVRLAADETALHLLQSLMGVKSKVQISKTSIPEVIANMCSTTAMVNWQEAMVRRKEMLERTPGAKPELTPTGNDVLGLTVDRKVLHWPSKRGKKFVSALPLLRGKGKPIQPTVASVANGTYPLGFTWRVYAHPDASELVLGCLKACVGAHEGSLVNTQYVKSWLLPAGRSAPTGPVWVMEEWYWDGALQAAAKVYRKSHPDVDVRFAIVRSDFGKRFHAGDVDILAYSAPYPHFGGQRIENELKGLYGPTLPEETVAYRGLVAVVPPTNTIQSITWAHARYVASHDLTPWTLLGRDGKKWVHKYYSSWYVLRECLFEGKTYNRVRIRQTLKRPRSGKRSELLAHAKEDIELQKKVYRKIDSLPDLLEALADDPEGIGLVLYNRRVQASGLKILKLGGSKGAQPIAPTPAAIAGGAYPARLAMKVLVHPKATPASRHFVKWLSSAQAAKVMKDYSIFSPALADMPPVKPTTPAPVATTRKSPVVSFKKPISGAVAVLPSETLSRYFLMTRPQHHAAYEQSVTEAIGRDQRLKIVDRTALARVLVERELGMALAERESPKPVLVADVFVLPQVISEETGSLLRIQALHGATGSVLGELRVSIDPASPTRFTPSLASRVQQWWPGVLKRLWLAGNKPVWSLLDVYSQDARASAQAAEVVRVELRKRLKQDRRRFLADYAPLDATCREVLMRLLGLSRSWQGRFSPAADYLIEGRLTSATRLELRVLSAGGKQILARTTVESKTPVALAARGWAWLDTKAPDLSAQVDGSKGAVDDWGKPQARLEFEKGKSASLRAKRFFTGAELRRMKTGSPALPAADRTELDLLYGQARRHFLRAVQLDPTWEEPAYRALDGVLWGSPTVDQFGRYVMLAEAYTRFTETFPQSKRGRGAMEYAHVYWRILAGRLRPAAWQGGSVRGLPRGVDYRKLYLRYLRKTLEVNREYLKRYLHRHKTFHGGCWNSIQIMTEHYFYDTAMRLSLTKASDKEVRQAVADHAELLDKYPAEAIDSDFLKLQVIGWRNDKPGFLKLLTAMQKRHPDPKDQYWRRGADFAGREIYRLFGVTSGDKNTFEQWRKGKRGPGDLPHAGYDPNKDKRTPTARPWE